MSITIRTRYLAIVLLASGVPAHADPMFNMDLLEKNENLPSVDLQRFNQSNEQPEGSYRVDMRVNGKVIATRKDILFKNNSQGILTPCLTKADLLHAGVSSAVLVQAVPDDCLDIAGMLPDSQIKFDFQHQVLDMSIPQALMTRHVRDAIPRSQWDEGISALQMNYRYSGAQQHDKQGGADEVNNYLSLNGGLNMGAWRLRSNGSLTQGTNQPARWETASTWLERDIGRWKSELTVGDAFTSGEIFDSVQLRGVGLASDDEMLPDSQKGFAPVIRGIAKSNAQVTVRQNGYILYQTYVTPGAFVIDDLYPTANSGDLEVTIKESDGQERHFIQPYASVSQMQREGYLKYNLYAGRYHGNDSANQPWMTQLALLRGFSHSLTLSGGIQAAENYHNLAAGIGKGVGEWGAVSLQLLNADFKHKDQQRRGHAWQGQYVKSLEMLGTTLTVNGWRYSHDRYYTLSDAYSNDDSAQEVKKSTLQIMLNQTITDGLSLYLSMNQDRYWSGSSTQESANIGLSGQLADVSWSLSYSRTHASGSDGDADNDNNDRVIALSLSLQMDKLLPDSYLNYSMSSSQQSGIQQMVGVNGTLLNDRSLSYSVNQNMTSEDGQSGDISLGYTGRAGDVNAGFSEDKQQSRLDYSADGGMIIHRHGIVFSPQMNGSAVLVDTNGAGGVALQNQASVITNSAGYAVLPYATAYRQNTITLDSHSLPENVDLSTSSVTLVPTKDAIVEAHFKTHVGYKALLTLRHNGQFLPFGAQVTPNDEEKDGSIVANDGQVYLSGLQSKGYLQAQWGNAASEQCTAKYDLTEELQHPSQSFIIQKTLSCL
ncbi:TPA: fimbria/pilus outer membrane usher protein [Citrobacter freundii]